MTLSDLCKLLGLAPDSPPEKIREAIAALPPGEKLDEMACRVVGIEPEMVAVAGIVDYSQEIAHHTYSDPQAIYLPVSTDPAAAHQLAMAALEKGWELSLHYGVPPAAASRAQSGLCFRVEGKTAMHAAALAVAITGLERSKP